MLNKTIYMRYQYGNLYDFCVIEERIRCRLKVFTLIILAAQ
jgi:hypothetical protein